MANPEHLKILKQGAEAWNVWREENNISQPNLKGANLQGANLLGANLRNANLSKANLRGADLRVAGLNDADLSSADLNVADLRMADLRNANLRASELIGANLGGAHLGGTDFNNAIIGWWTAFGNNDLSGVKGLESFKHEGPSVIGVDTVYKSRGKIPEMFLRGCGVPEDFITYARSLTTQPIEFYSCFISYSSKDQEFLDRLHADLQSKGVRCWFAPEDLKIGDKTRDRIDESIRLHDKLLLVLSEHSVSSQWVEHEVEAALERERREGRLVLFPIRLDEAVMETTTAWAANIRRSRNVGDFRQWKSHDDYQKALNRVLRDLKAAADH